MPQPVALSALRRAVAALEPGAVPEAGARFALGLSALDAWLGGGLARGVLHEVHAGQARHPAASIGFGLGLAARACAGRQLVWVRQDRADAEGGGPCGDGLAAFGLDPGRVLVVRAGDPAGSLRAAGEAARCPGLGAALVEIRGMPRALDLTASRRLALAAEASGVTLVMVRLGADPVPSAAASRWRVEAAASAALEANAPGRPAFAAALLRHRSGLGPRTWCLEWDRDSATFAAPTPSFPLRSCPPLPRPAVPVPAHGPAAAPEAAAGTTPGGAPAEPLVLTEPVAGALRLAALSPEALALGLRPGMTLADARARVPDLDAHPHEPAEDAALLRRMAATCDRWSPLVALDPPDGLLLDVTGVAHLFGGEPALREVVVARFRGAGFAARAALAGTPDAARALARLGREVVVPPGGEEAALRPLPVRALGLDAATRSGLALAGLRRIADLADLPSGPLTARFGADLPTRLRRVLGQEDIRITPLRPAPACRVERRFPEPIAHAGAVEAALRALIGRAAARLEAAGEGGRSFEARFFRADGGVRCLRVETGRPSRDPRAILILLRERLDALADPLDPGYGFDLIRLDVTVTEPLAPLQGDLDGGTRVEDAVCDLVDRLVARFGPARVLRFARTDTHDPARAARLVPAAAAPDRPAWSGAQPGAEEPGEPPLRPLHLFEPPQPIEALAEVPDGPPLRFLWRREHHRVVRAEGPERIAPEWWRDPGAATRDYYRVEDEAGRRFWVFRAGLYGRETDRPRWFLHGLFA